MSSGGSQQESGCGVWIAAAFVIALVVAALISIAALIDPFNWLPPVGEIWEDCSGDCTSRTASPGSGAMPSPTSRTSR